MTPNTAADGLAGLVALAAVVAIWYGPLQWVAVDWTRERMFAVRERLFDVAAAGHIDFADARYQAIRSRINDNIRFAHVGSLPRIFFHHSLRSGSNGEIQRRMREIADSLGDRCAREAAHAALDEVEFAFVTLLILKSPLLSLFSLSIFLARGAAERRPRRSGDGFLRDSLRLIADIVQAEVPALIRIRA